MDSGTGGVRPLEWYDYYKFYKKYDYYKFYMKPSMITSSSIRN